METVPSPILLVLAVSMLSQLVAKVNKRLTTTTKKLVSL